MIDGRRVRERRACPAVADVSQTHLTEAQRKQESTGPVKPVLGVIAARLAVQQAERDFEATKRDVEELEKKIETLTERLTGLTPVACPTGRVQR